MPRVRRRARYHHLTQTETERILELRDVGLSLRQIATRVGRDVSTVQRCVSHRLRDQQRLRTAARGARRQTSERTDRHIRRLARSEPFTTAGDMRRQIASAGRPTVSAQTIRRRLHDIGLRARRPAGGVPVTARHRTQRLAWCRARQRWRLEWRSILFSDESRFCLGRNDCRRLVWRPRGQRHEQRFTRERHTGPTPGIMVWGGIMYGSRTSLVCIPGTLTAARYVDLIVEPVVQPFLRGVPGAIFQQDNARPHVARAALNSLRGLDVLPWPAASPDLSPIEHVWDAIGRQLQRDTPARDLDELRAQVIAAWRNIPQATINNLIDSMPRRVHACIGARGAHTEY